MSLDLNATTASRRRLLRDAGLGAAAFGALAAGATLPTTAEAAGVTDADVLNFALNLEYLEAEFYLRATTGRGLAPSEATGSGTPGGVDGGLGRPVPFVSSYIRELAQDIAQDEHEHVTFLRSALGSYKVARPAIEFHSSFTGLARAAGLTGPNGIFDPFANETNFLVAAYIFEDVGVTAYHGGARLISNKDYLSAAAGILAVEAYHAGAIRYAILRSGNADAAQATNKISALRATLSGAKDDSGIAVTRGAFNLAPTDSNAVAFERTPTQVLNIVYGSTTTKPGLFFPKGLNGLVR